MIVRIKHNCSNSYIPYIGVIYFNELLDSDDVKILPHENAKSANASPYTRMSQKTLEREKLYWLKSILYKKHMIYW